MRKTILFITLWSLSAMAFCQAEVTYLGTGADNAVLVRCESSNPGFRDVGEAGVVIELENAHPILRKAAPDVPRTSSAVIVDDQAAMQVVVQHAEFVEYSGIQVAPSKGNLLRTVDPNTVPYAYGPEYDLNEFYPGALAALGEAYVQGHYRAQSLHFNPVQYNPVTGIMRLYTSIEVAVVPTGQTGQNPITTSPPAGVNETMDELYRARFINYADHAERYTQIGEIGNMLVVSHATYFDELEPWIQWKKEKGISVELVDVATVNSVNQIKALITNRYNNDGLTFVVLVGDEDQVPVQLVSNPSGVGYCDACYGYITGNDNYTEVFVGHLLVHNGNELAPVITKILEYEKQPYMASDWFSVAMGIGSGEGAGYGDEDEADWQHQNKIKEDLLDFTYTQVYERYEGNRGPNSPTGGTTADESGNPPASSLTTVINSGCSLINYTGHGDHSLIVTGSYNNSSINALSNAHKWPYWIIVGCCVGDYDDDSGSGDTFGETWLKTPSANAANPTGGIGGAFSTVFQSWAPPMEAQDEMNKLIADMAGFSTRHTLGSIHYHGCHSMNDVYGQEGDDMTDTWILMADPSIQLRTAFPTYITATHPESAFFGVTSLTVSSATEDAMVCITFGGEIIATGLIENGTCTLTFPAVPGPGELLVTLSGFNTVPYQGTVELLPQNGPFVVNPLNSLDDSAANNNGQADYTESVLIDVTLENIGIAMASDVVAILSTTDPNVTITDATHDAGSISAAETIVLEDAFAFTVASDVEDQHVVMFTVTLEDNQENTWSSPLPVVVNAPVLECTGDPVINDSTGNGNGRLDSGETVEITVEVMNSGHSTTVDDVIAVLTENSAFVNITGGTVNGGGISPNGSALISFTATVDANAPDAAVCDLSFEATSGAYSTECAFGESVNLIVEDWENGLNSGFNWGFAGNADWFITGTNPYEGAQCMQSGDIGDNQSTTLTLSLTVTQEGPVQFAYRVNSEGGYDFLRFRVNGTQIQQWSGIINWTTYSYNLTPGEYLLEWVYAKDVIFSSGDDAAWVDEIILPPSISVGVEERTGGQSLSAFPNPALDHVFVTGFKSNEPLTIRLEDLSGRLMWNSSVQHPEEAPVQVPMVNFAAGVYLVRLVQGNETQVIRVVKGN
ncbi:MAG: C25 family cysteine peptidase [Flavobacteriales bacterium]